MRLHFPLRRLLKDVGGNSMLEFALLAPILASFVMGMSDLARGLARKYQIEQASYRALEMITVGSLQTDYETLVKPEAAAASGEPESNVTVTNWLECDGALKEPFSETCTSTQQTARFVKVQIVSDFEPNFPYIADLIGGADGKVRLTSRSTLRVQ